MTNQHLSLTDQQQYWSFEKPVAKGQNGMVASHHIAASEVGADILRKGGNAIDAAIATSIAISVLEPWMSGIGGGSFMTYYSAADKKVQTVHFGMKAPKNLVLDDFVLSESGEGGDLFAWPGVVGDVNVNGWKSIGVPGHIAGLDLVHRTWGTMAWSDLYQPGIELAEKGLPLTWNTTLRIATGASQLRKDKTASETYLRDGLPPVGVAGQPVGYLPLGNLPATLKTIAEEGAGVFYDGALARSMVQDLKDGGGYFCDEDFSGYRAEIEPAISFERSGKTVHTTGGMTSGPSMRLAFERMKPLSQGTSEPSPQDVAAWAEAIRSSYETRFETMGDSADETDPACTTHLTVVDGEGNMVALTQTLLSIFGAKVMLPGSGILMNNGMMWFDPRPGRPNSMAPGKRPLSNMAPTVITNSDGSPFAALGASGGRRIFPCLLQIISRMVDFGADIGQALHAPRIDVSGTTASSVDPEFGEEVLKAVNDVLPASLLERAVLPAHYALPSGIAVSADGQAGCVEPTMPKGGAVSA